MKDYSVILPAYNEEKFLADSVKVLLERKPDEIIIVEDGCEDSTPEIASRLSDRYPEVKHIHSNTRLGKGAAIVEGVKASGAERVCFMDVDLSTDLGDLKNLIDSLESYDFALGSRYLDESSVNRSGLRLVASKVYNILADTVLSTGVEDHQCGFKAFRKDSFLDIERKVEAEGWFWDTELIYHASQKGYSLTEIPVNWNKASDSEVGIVSTGIEMMNGIYRLKMSEILGSKFESVNEYFKFAIIGGTGAVLNSVVLYALTEYLGMFYIFSSLVAIETAILFMFFLNNSFTFKETKSSLREVSSGILLSNLIRSVGTIINIALLWLFTNYLGIYYILSNLMAIFIASVVNYFGERRFNWNHG